MIIVLPPPKELKEVIEYMSSQAAKDKFYFKSDDDIFLSGSRQKGSYLSLKNLKMAIENAYPKMTTESIKKILDRFPYMNMRAKELNLTSGQLKQLVKQFPEIPELKKIFQVRNLAADWDFVSTKPKNYSDLLMPYSKPTTPLRSGGRIDFHFSPV